MEEINLYKLLAFYAKNWILILSLTAAGLLSGFVYNQYVQKPMYKSNATILFVNPGSSTSTQDATLLSNYVQLFESRRVLEPVISAQKLGVTYDEFKPSVQAVNEKGTEVISLSVSTNNADKSQRFLKAAVESFKEQIASLYGADKLKVVDNASNNGVAFNVKQSLQLAIAGAAGLILALIVLFFIYDARGDKPFVKQKANKAVKVKAVKPLKAVRKPGAWSAIKQYFAEPKDNAMLLPRPNAKNLDDDVNALYFPYAEKSKEKTE